MTRSIFIAACLVECIICTSCNHNKPKAVSQDVTKTTVRVNGKKDSVINNAQKDYGNATVAEPCVKCLIQVVQNDANYKHSVAAKPAQAIKYLVNWVPSNKADSLNKKGATNGIRVDIIDKSANDKKLASFIYDNALSKLYFVNSTGNGEKTELKTDAVTLKKIRDACYWGVASGR
jgi:hypothetical protein